MADKLPTGVMPIGQSVAVTTGSPAATNLPPGVAPVGQSVNSGASDGWDEGWSGVLTNLPRSAYNFINGLGETIETIGINGVAPWTDMAKERKKQLEDGLANTIPYYKQTYGSWQNIKRQAISDPVGTLADASSIFDFGAGSLDRIAARVGEETAAHAALHTAANVTKQAAKYTNPMTPAVAVAQKVLKPVTGGPGAAYTNLTDAGINPDDLNFWDYQDQNPTLQRAKRFFMQRSGSRPYAMADLQKTNSAIQNRFQDVANGQGPVADRGATGVAAKGVFDKLDEETLARLQAEEQWRVDDANYFNQRDVDTRNTANQQAIDTSNLQGQALTDKQNQTAMDRYRAQEALEAQSDASRNNDRDTAKFVINDIANSVGDPLPHDEVGNLSHEGIQTNSGAFQAEGNIKYDALDKGTANGLVDVRAGRDAIVNLGKLASGLDGKIAALKGADVDAISKMAEKWKDVPDFVSFKDARDITSALKGLSRDAKSLINSRSAGATDKLTAIMESNMQQAAQGMGMLDQYKDANNFWRQGKQLYNESYAARMMDANPEDAVKNFWNQGITKINEGQQALAGQPGWDALRGRGIHDLLEASSPAGELDPALLQKNWNKYPVKTQQAMLGDKWKDFNAAVDHYAAYQTPADRFEPKVPGEIPFQPQTFEPEQYKPEQPKPVSIDRTIQQRLVRGMAARSPEKLADLMIRPGYETTARELQNTLPAPLYGKIQNQAIDRLVTKFSAAPVGGGDMVLKRPGDLWMYWNQKLTEPQRIAIAGEGKPILDKLIEGAKDTDVNMIPTLKKALYHNITEGPMAVAGGAASMTGHGFVSAAVALLMISPGGIYKMLRSPAGRAWLTKGITLPVGTAQASKWVVQAQQRGGFTPNN